MAKSDFEVQKNKAYNEYMNLLSTDRDEIPKMKGRKWFSFLQLNPANVFDQANQFTMCVLNHFES